MKKCNQKGVFHLLIVILIQIISSLAAEQSCELKGSQQAMHIDDIIKLQTTNLCQKLTLNDIIITCDNTTSQSNLDTLLELKVNSLEMNNVAFNCDNIEINAEGDVSILNSTFGIIPVGRCCSFLTTYTLNVQSKGTITLSGQIKHLKSKYGMMIFNAQKNIQISDADITAGNLAFHSLNILQISNSKITSLFVFCHDDYKTLVNKTKFSPEKLMQLKTSDTNEYFYQITHLSELSKANKQSEYNAILNSLKYYYSLLIYSENVILLETNTLISGSRIAFFSESADFSQSSKVDSTGQGCPANFGLGKGLYLDTTQKCAVNGASQASSGGIGLPLPSSDTGQISLDDINSCIFYLQQSSFVLQNIPYSYSSIYEGSGGTYKDEIKQFQNMKTEGAGGGLITIYTSKQAILDGVIQSDGNSFESVKGSGGSGGAITVKSKKIHGTGIISVKGGDSDIDGLNGEGAGGIITLYQLDWTLDKGVNQYNGTIQTDKGQRNFTKYNLSSGTKYLLTASTGTFVSFICPAGYEPQSNGFCKQCEVGYYKSGLVGKCRKCSKPINFGKVVKPIQNQQSFTELSDCFENCIEFNCDPLRFYVKNVISLRGISFLILYIFVICSGYISRRILRMKTKKIDSIPIQHVKYDYDDINFAKECKEKDIFLYRDLLYHKYRIQFYGENNINSQWYLQPQIPEGTDQIFDSKDFAEFALVLKWKKIDIWILRVLNYVYFPLYWFYLLKVQKKMYKKIKDKIHDEPYPKFLKGSNAVHQEYIRMKITKSDDYTLLSLDLFNYNKRNQKYFKKTIPTIIHFSGEGSYLKPYYIWPRDHFLQSVFYSTNSKRIRNKGNPNDVYVFGDNNKFHMENSKTFENFITELNKISSTIDFYSHGQYLLSCFQELVTLCNRFNQIFLQYLDLKVHILIMEIPFNDQFDVDTQRISATLLQCTQAFKQRITLIEDQNSDKFVDTIDRIQKIKINQLPYDIKLSMFIFSTSEDMEDLQKQLFPELEIEQEPTGNQYGSTQLQNPFASTSDYQSHKMSNLLDYNPMLNSPNLPKEEYYQSLNQRNSLNKQTIADFMQHYIQLI